MNKIQLKFLENAQKSLAVARQINETGYPEFGQYFAKNERVPKKYHRYLIEAEKLRKGADYNLDIEISCDEATQIIQQAEEMLLFAFDHL